jgi:hypothetical protein
MNQEPEGYTVRPPTAYEIDQDIREKIAEVRKYARRILTFIGDETLTVEVINAIVKDISKVYPEVPGIKEFVENYNFVRDDEDKKHVFWNFIKRTTIEQVDVIGYIYNEYFTASPTHGGGKRSTGKKVTRKQKQKTRSAKKKAKKAKKTKASRRR